MQAFYRQERVNVNTFYGWRSKLRARTVVTAHRAAVREESSEPAGAFIDLEALEGSATRYEIRLDLGRGVVLQVVRG